MQDIYELREKNNNNYKKNDCVGAAIQPTNRTNDLNTCNETKGTYHVNHSFCPDQP